MKRIFLAILVVLAAGTSALFAYGYFLGDTVVIRSEQPASSASTTTVYVASQITKGEYLARAANCMGCHTTRGGFAYAGGRVISSEFGDFVSPNLTPDVATGIGSWNADQFWNALHNGRSKDDRLLYPAFPFTSYTQMTREDADAMFAYFKSIPAIKRENQAHTLRFPYDQRPLLAFWRALYFRPGEYQSDSKQSVDWNRGAYLVKGLAHCGACHTSRNALGASDGANELGGAIMPISRWYAPSLVAQDEAALSTWSSNDISTLLRTGVSEKAHASGPMAEVVSNSLQYLSDGDIHAMTSYLRSLPGKAAPNADVLDRAIATRGESKEEMARIMLEGGSIYKNHCIDCHGAEGKGAGSVYPALKANPAVLMSNAGNPIRIILSGGFPATTAGNPRPYGMPPFAPTLTDGEVALVLSYIRNAWGNQAGVVSASEVNRYRTAPLD
ncbi:cytochrome c [Undibacterium sp. RTI2.1]|uniref:cytochrome c n=1 Tax=unclassified Undibacterium TaxID=2630295 RepID=UPI002AB591F6|nr:MULTISPECIES: cytochrome c [unclassified Undibacterium]MDY7536986.1 cytochrome c [Undibacterium sp. 5I1]MEB0030477.1 cytochrome c [Undibacterium sp. RTI2.1]MEB0115260.1 cytochrome c [Undibacterium sp. RTI2.2]MEB0231333.1 cytochrome c [Undibacterium sp. 10I3]MEB0258746.1 cytochrome c [Undibacterium sp. 5I1]